MARGFGIGDFAKAFNTTYDTVNKVAQDFEVAKIVNEKPIDATGLSTEQNEQVFQSLADGGTARDVKNDDGSFGGVAVSKPMPEGVEGPAPAQTLAPQKITTYLGREFVGGLDPAKATSARNRALAGVITKSDPIQGMKLDALLTQDERADQDYDEKQQLRTLRQQFVGEKDSLKRAEIGGKIAALTGGGEFLKGFGDMEKAQYDAVVRHTRGLLARGDVKGAMNVYNRYPNGENGEVVDLPGGGFQLNFYQGKPGEGSKPTSSKTFKTLDEVSQWYDDQFDPEAAMKRRTELAAKQAELRTWQAKEDYQQNGRLALEDRKAGRLRPGYKWITDADGDTRQVRADGGGGSGAGTKSSGAAGGGVPMKDADRIIARHFTAKDAETGSSRLNTTAAASARLLIPMTQSAASGDAVGATYEAIQRYEAVLERAGGDHAKAAQIVRSIIQQRSGAPQATAPTQPAATAATSATQGKGGVVLSQESLDRIKRGDLKSVPNPFNN
jgi:hypothetical protein